MKKFLFIISLLFVCVSLHAQTTYQPYLFNGLIKPFGAYGTNTIDARSMYYDVNTFKFRPYADTTEVSDYLNTPYVRQGYFKIYVQDDNSDSIYVWWYDTGTSRKDLHRFDPSNGLYMDYDEVVSRLNQKADKSAVLTKQEADARYNEKIKNISFSVYNYNNNTLTIPNTPIDRLGFVLYLNGIKQDENRFSVSGNTVNLNFMPNGDIITVAYWVEN